MMPLLLFFNRLGDGDGDVDDENSVSLELEVSDIDAISKSRNASSWGALEKQEKFFDMKIDLRWRAAPSLGW